MAQRKKRRRARSKETQYPPFVWMLFGLAIGLSVAVAVYVKDREPSRVPQAAAPRPASMQGALDDNDEPATPSAKIENPRDKRFTFYDILPNFEVVTPDKEPEVKADREPRAIEEPGVYVLQAGSFSTNQDADRRRAELALHGIESHIQRVKVNDRNYHRVYIGPTDDLDELNLLRSRLRAAKIDVLRIRLSD
ncbi:MAG: SPOR domain-containing protein [Gammaproteobacteria bacterium]|nr:SPOR domain-containing protein [Gammaproteobacteria bacterium]MBT8109564.1 SPOR domain-containing protein [Gammaproteobacteria bacterium]NND46157.1 SPOR domain-containing protein [Woeseiaceae bacterium]NNL44266.1 SPOR domain-containing protein [Woeseiaceae bacterium]